MRDHTRPETVEFASFSTMKNLVATYPVIVRLCIRDKYFQFRALLWRVFIKYPIRFFYELLVMSGGVKLYRFLKLKGKIRAIFIRVSSRERFHSIEHRINDFFDGIL